MFIAVIIRTWITAKLVTDCHSVNDSKKNLRLITFGVGLIGSGWGLGWVLIAPELNEGLRTLYLYIITGAMFLGMFGYGVHWPTFYAFAIPSMVPPISSVIWPQNLFPWPFALGITTLFVASIKIAKNFSTTFEDSVSQKFRNEQLYSDLVRERDASIAANIAKSTFIASASHDLRQPMHAINLYLNGYDPSDSGEKTRHIMEKIKEGTNTLNSMFNRLLTISRLDSYSMQINPQEFSLNDLVQSVANITLPKAQAKGLNITFDFPKCTIFGDQFVLRQVILNLISNAIQYTSEGNVRVQFGIEQNSLSFSVSDTGCGITPDALDKIFEDFYRADRSRHLHDGLGLGLTIVKRLCDLIGGKITVRSEVDEGSHFEVKTFYPVVSEKKDLPILPPSPLAHPITNSLIGYTIAVIEDDKTVLEGYRFILSEKGARVICLSEVQGEWGDQLLNIEKIHCIVSDYRLRQTTGDAVINSLREHFNEEIPAVIVTADTSPSHIQHFRQLDISILYKPISFVDLLTEISALLNQSAKA